MAVDIKSKRYKTCTVIGSMLFLIFNSQVHGWGNLAAYISSYFFCHQNEVNLEQKIPWVLSTFLIFRSIGVMSYPLLMKVTGKRCSAVVGVLVSDVAIFTCYFSVQRSFLAFTFTFGVCMGLGTGFLYACAMRLMVSWANNNDLGRLIAIVQSSIPLGAIGITQFVTLYLNPFDQLPEIRLENSRYFAQKDILDKIPSLFLIMGGVILTLHLLGLALVRETNSCKDEEGRHNVNSRADNSAVDNYDDTTAATSGQKPARTSISGENKTSIIPLSGMNSADGTSNDRTSQETFKKGTFVAVWVVLFSSECSLLPFLNFNKIFGEIWIHDDHFLTDLITVNLVVNICMRGLGGICVDKFGPKLCLYIINLIGTLILLWYYFIARVDKWLYFAVSMFYGLCPGGFYICYPCIVADLFGKKQFTSNYAYMKTVTVVVNLTAPWVMGIILTQCGWFFLFTSGAISSLLSNLVLLLFLHPQF